MKSRYVIRRTEDYLPPDWTEKDFEYTDHFAWLEDTKTGKMVYSDCGEPEDMILYRNLYPFVLELNRLASEVE